MDVQELIVNRDQHMRPLEYDLSENFNELLRYMQDMGILDNVPVGTTSESEIVSISDAYPAPPRALNVYGKSTQDGAPTPESPVPILSVDDLALEMHGKNLFDQSLMKDQAAWNTIKLYAPTGTVLTMSTNHNTGSAGTAGDLPTYFRQPNSSQGTGNLVNFHHSVTQTVGAQGYVEIIQRRASGEDSFANYEWQIELGSTATAYEPYQGTTVPDLLPEGTNLRSLPDGTKDTLNLAYLKPSEREGWAWYSRELVAYTGSTTTAATDGITGTVGVDVMSTTGEIADGPTVLYKLASAQTTTLDPIKLPELPAPTATVWCDGGSAQPTYSMEYVRDTNTALADLSEAIADIVSG